MKKGNRVLNYNEVKNIERLINENVDENTILEVMNISKNTFLRIKAGKHFLQLQKKEERTAEPVVKQEDKLDTIIELLKELVQAWR